MDKYLPRLNKLFMHSDVSVCVKDTVQCVAGCIQTYQQGYCDILTLSQPPTTKMPPENTLDPDEKPSNSASRPEPSCLALG